MYSEEPYRYGFSANRECASGFYPDSAPITKEEIAAVQTFLEANSILPENTRVRKVAQTEGQLGASNDSYILQIASAEENWLPTLKTPPHLNLPGNPALIIKTGDYASNLKRIVEELRNARIHVGNKEQGAMIDALVDCFVTGDHQAFKAAQKFWVQDQSPSVELVIGFIETYQDPHGVRGSWGGIAAIVNREQSRKFQALAERSLEFIALLPWNGPRVGLPEGTLSAFESNRFIMPDFTSLDSKLCETPFFRYLLFLAALPLTVAIAVGFLKSEAPGGLNLPNVS